MVWVTVPALPGAGAGTNRITSVDLPPSVAGGRPFTLAIRATPRAATLAYAVQDRFPTNWTVQSISHGGSYDPWNHLIKWGPFYDDGERDLAYTILPPPTAAGTVSFGGLGSFDGFDVVVAGNRTDNLTAGPPAWNLSTVDGTGPRFQLSGVPSTGYVIEASTNLINWQLLESITTDSRGTYSLRPPSPNLSRHRFFRARTGP
jgi:hypothetical protein